MNEAEKIDELLCRIMEGLANAHGDLLGARKEIDQALDVWKRLQKQN